MPDNFRVAVEQLAGYPKLRATADGQFVGQRKFKVAWTDYSTLLEDLLGGSIPDGEGSLYTPPARWPDPKYDQLYCDSVDVDPLAGEEQGFAPGITDGNGVLNYLFAEVVANYKVGSFNPGTLDNATMREERIEYSAEMLSLSTEKMAWDQSGTRAVQADVTVGRVMGTMDYLVYLPQRAVLPLTGIAQAVGKVNSFPITAFPNTPGATTFAAETLLFLPPSAARTVQASGFPRWSIQYRLSFKDTGWNNFFDPEAATSAEEFRPIYRKTGTSTWSLFKPHKPFNYLPLLL